MGICPSKNKVYPVPVPVPVAVVMISLNGTPPTHHTSVHVFDKMEETLKAMEQTVKDLQTT